MSDDELEKIKNDPRVDFVTETELFMFPKWYSILPAENLPKSCDENTATTNNSDWD